MKVLVLCLLSLVTASSVLAAKKAPPPRPVVAAHSAEEEKDKASVTEFVLEVNKAMQEKMEMPEGVTATQTVEEVVFADGRRAALVGLKVVFKMNNQIVDEALVVFFVAKESPTSWGLKGVIARPTDEILKRRAKQQEGSNGTEL